MPLLIGKWINFITYHRVKSFSILLALLIVTGLLMRPSSFCLVTPSTPLAIVDLELAFNQVRADSIKQIWDDNTCSNRFMALNNGTEAAVVNILLDFLFIIGYTGFFIELIVLSAKNNASLNSVITLRLCQGALLAGGMDVIENIFMLLFLKAFPVSSYFFAIPSSIKFGLIVLLIVGILTRLIGKRVGSLKT